MNLQRWAMGTVVVNVHTLIVQAGYCSSMVKDDSDPILTEQATDAFSRGPGDSTSHLRIASGRRCAHLA